MVTNPWIISMPMFMIIASSLITLNNHHSTRVISDGEASLTLLVICIFYLTVLVGIVWMHKNINTTLGEYHQ